MRLPGGLWWWWHSAACSLAWLAADARPGKISKVGLIGGFPSPDGETYFDAFPVQDGAMPFPGWSEFEGPDSADLDDTAKQALASAAIPVPEGVTRGVIRLADERRHDVPVVLICPEFTAAQAREWIEQGEVPELAESKNVSFLDIDSGSLAHDQRAGRARAPPGAGGCGVLSGLGNGNRGRTGLYRHPEVQLHDQRGRGQLIHSASQQTSGRFGAAFERGSQPPVSTPSGNLCGWEDRGKWPVFPRPAVRTDRVIRSQGRKQSPWLAQGTSRGCCRRSLNLDWRDRCRPSQRRHRVGDG